MRAMDFNRQRNTLKSLALNLHIPLMVKGLLNMIYHKEKGVMKQERINGNRIQEDNIISTGSFPYGWFRIKFHRKSETNNIKYVIISGYVAILFGRSRMSEDVDIFIENISFEKFLKFWSGIEQNYECLNTGNSYEAYNDYFEKSSSHSNSKKRKFYSHIELKFVKNDLDRYSLENRKHVKLAERSLNLSPLELQIPYKIFLGSEKDIEDARFLFKLFKDHLNIVLPQDVFN